MRALNRFTVVWILGVSALLLGMSLLAGGVPTNPSPGLGGASLSPVSPGLLSDANAALCPRLEAQYPGMNLTAFTKVCDEPSFVTAYERWGNFSGQSIAGQWIQDPPRWVLEDYVYIVNGESHCGNLTNGPPTAMCDEQATWLVNVTTGEVSGPFYYEHYLIMFGSGGSLFPPLSSSAEVALVLVVAAFIVVGAVLFVTRYGHQSE